MGTVLSYLIMATLFTIGGITLIISSIIRMKPFGIGLGIFFLIIGCICTGAALFAKQKAKTR